MGSQYAISNEHCQKHQQGPNSQKVRPDDAGEGRHMQTRKKLETLIPREGARHTLTTGLGSGRTGTRNHTGGDKHNQDKAEVLTQVKRYQLDWLSRTSNQQKLNTRHRCQYSGNADWVQGVVTAQGLSLTSQAFAKQVLHLDLVFCSSEFVLNWRAMS